MLQLIDRATGKPVEGGAVLSGHYGVTEWKFGRVHTFPRETDAGYVGGMICVRGATGRQTTTTVESFPHLYWSEVERPTSVPCTVCGAPLSIGEGSTCADSGAPCGASILLDMEAVGVSLSDAPWFAVVDFYDWGFIRWARADEPLGVDETLDTRITRAAADANLVSAMGARVGLYYRHDAGRDFLTGTINEVRASGTVSLGLDSVSRGLSGLVSIDVSIGDVVSIETLNAPTPEPTATEDRELSILSQRIEDECAALIVAKLPPSERHNVVCRLAHRFGWEVTESDLYAAARELGIDLDA